MRDIQSPEDIKVLIDAFYAKLLISEIAYIFTDVAKIELEHHLPILYSFWNSVLFYSSEYRGNAMQVHLALNEKTPLEPGTFEIWLQLFGETVDGLFQGPKAEEAKSKAQSIGQLMQFKIAQRRSLD